MKIGQPAVIGEILAGILLGPSFLGIFFPDIAKHFLPSTSAQFHLLEGISLLGVLFLLFVTGLEIDFGLIRRQIKVAIGVALGGLVLPLIAGFGLGYILPEEFLSSPGSRGLTACFFAVAMAISAIPVVARVLMELELTRRNVAQTLFAAAMIDDAVGWILLSSIIGLASTGVFSTSAVLTSLLSVLGLAILSLTLGRYIVGRFLDFLFNRGLSHSMLSYTISLLFLWAWFSQSLHLEAIFGAFILGVIFSLTPKLSGDVLHTIETVTNQIFAPLFFALAGLKINIQILAEPSYMALAATFVFLATASKFIGVYAGARLLGGSSHWPALFFASGLNARGSMGIIVATIGLSLGILTEELYAVVVLMAIITSIFAPPALRACVRRIEPDQEEKDRLKREELESAGFFASMKRVLIPLRPRTIEDLEKYQLNEVGVFKYLRAKQDIEATILTAVENEDSEVAQKFVDEVVKSFPSSSKKKIVKGERPADLILDEAKKGYDLMLLGVTKSKGQTRAVFNPLVDYILRMSGCPVILVQGKLPEESARGSRILVPTGGSISSKRATELSFLFLQDPKSQLHLLKVIEEFGEQTNNVINQRQVQFGRQVVNDLVSFASAHGVHAIGETRLGPDPETVILETIIRKEIDLLILGTRVRPLGERLYLGPRIERILKEASCPVIVFNT